MKTSTGGSLVSVNASSEMIGAGPLSSQQVLLPYSDKLDARELDHIDLLVIHCTELPDLATARTYGHKLHYPESGTGNSGHFYIDRDGHCEQWVPLRRVAHHVRGYNERSIGVELVNRGRFPDWFDSRRQDDHERYPGSQIVALLELIGQLRSEVSSLQLIAGHEDLDRTRVAASNLPASTVARKRDPGPTFPWARVEAACGLKRFCPEPEGSP